jgi:hypothetical protein
MAQNVLDLAKHGNADSTTDCCLISLYGPLQEITCMYTIQPKEKPSGLTKFIAVYITYLSGAPAWSKNSIALNASHNPKYLDI